MCTSYRLSMILCSALVLAGCKQQVLFSELSELEANQMVALMFSAGLSAEKVALNDRFFSVVTDRSSFPEATVLLHENDLPRPRFESLGDVFGDVGIMPSVFEERARLNYALSQEMANTLSNIDGVVMARVHLTIPRQEPFTRELATSSAAVFLKHRADINLDSSVPKIKALIVDGIENVVYEDVTVKLFAERTLVLPDAQSAPIKMQTDGYHISRMQLFGSSGWVLIGLLLMSTAPLSYAIARLSRRYPKLGNLLLFRNVSINDPEKRS